MNQKVAARPELKDPLTKLAHILQEQLHATEFDKAAKTLEELTTLVHATGADATAPKLDPNELLAAYKKLVPEMNKKVAENPSLKEPFTQAARQFQEALQAVQLGRSGDVPAPQPPCFQPPRTL